MEKETASWANGGSHAGSRQLFVDRVKGHTQLMKLAIEEMENLAKENVSRRNCNGERDSMSLARDIQVAELMASSPE